MHRHCLVAYFAECSISVFLLRLKATFNFKLLLAFPVIAISWEILLSHGSQSVCVLSSYLKSLEFFHPNDQNSKSILLQHNCLTSPTGESKPYFHFLPIWNCLNVFPTVADSRSSIFHSALPVVSFDLRILGSISRHVEIANSKLTLLCSLYLFRCKLSSSTKTARLKLWVQALVQASLNIKLALNSLLQSRPNWSAHVQFPNTAIAQVAHLVFFCKLGVLTSVAQPHTPTLRFLITNLVIDP